MNKFFIIYITILYIGYIQLLKNDNKTKIYDVNYDLNYSFIDNLTLKAFNSKYYSYIKLKNLTNVNYRAYTNGTLNISIDYINNFQNYFFNITFNDGSQINITPLNKILKNKIEVNNNSYIIFDIECYNNKLNICNCSNYTFCLNITSNEANILSFYIICHLFEYGGIYGVLIIPIGLFISLYGSIHHIITSIFYGIFYLFSLIQFISEEFTFDLYNDIYVVELIVSAILPGIILGFYLSNPDTKTVEFKREKIFFGSFLGMIIWNSFLYYISIPLISSNENNIKIMRYITIIPMIIFGIIFYKTKKNKIFFIINTIIVGSYLVIYGLNLILGGFYYNRIIFNNNFKFYDMENPSLLMYLILNIILIITSFFYQIYVRSNKDKGKKKQKKIKKVESEYQLDKSSSTLNDADNENISEQEENETSENNEEEFNQNYNNLSNEN